MGRKFWNIRAANEPGIGELLLYGPIGPDDGLGWLVDQMSPKQFRDDLNELGDIHELRVFMNSPGGMSSPVKPSTPCFSAAPPM